MKILKLHAENLKRLKVVDITPAGHVVEVSGANGSGKTSVLDAIWWTLGSGRAITSQPIRHGEANAYVEIDLGDLIVKRTFRRKDETDFTTSITVSTKDGAKYSNPQEVLNNLIGRLTFDPLDFARMSSGDQVKLLRSLVTNFDFSAADKANATDFDDRRMVNRRITEVEALLNTMPEVDAPSQPHDLTALHDELSAAHAQNNERAAALSEASTRHARIVAATEAVEKARKDLAYAEQVLAGLHDLDLAKPIIVPERVPIDAVRERIDRARAENDAYAAAEKRKNTKSQLARLEDESNALTQRIRQRNEAAAAAVRSSSIPVPGLSATSDGLMIDGVPFDQVSDAERLRASIAIASALNPSLRVLRVKDGSLLDSNSMELLKEFAAEHDMQIWIEVVTDGEPRGIVIEDGEVSHG